MKKNSITISFTYEAIETPKAIAGGIDDAIVSQLLDIKAAKDGEKALREQLRAFIKESKEAIDADKIEAILKAKKWSKQDISKEMLAFGLRRRDASKKKLAVSKELQTKAQAEFAALRKRYTLKEIAALGRRIQLLAQEASK